MGTAIEITLALFVALVLTTRKIIEVLDLEFFRLYKPIAISVFTSLLVILLIWALKGFLFVSLSYSNFIILAAIGVAFYVFLLYLIEKLEILNLTDWFKNNRKEL